MSFLEREKSLTIGIKLPISEDQNTLHLKIKCSSV